MRSRRSTFECVLWHRAPRTQDQTVSRPHLFEAVGMLRWKDPGFKRKATRERAVHDKMFGFVDNSAAVSDFVLEQITIIARVALLIELLRPIQQLANALRRSV